MKRMRPLKKAFIWKIVEARFRETSGEKNLVSIPLMLFGTGLGNEVVNTFSRIFGASS